MDQGHARNSVIGRWIIRCRKTDHHVTAADENKVGVVDVEFLPFAYNDP